MIVVFEKHEKALIDKKYSDCECYVGHYGFSAIFFLCHDSFGNNLLSLITDENVKDHL